MSELVTHRRRVVANEVQERQIDGRAFLVAPVVAAKEGVMNGELLPADELGRYFAAWEDVPVPVTHPAVNGLNVSARTPDQVARALGRFYDVRMDGTLLKGNIYLDVARAEALGGDMLAALVSLRAGEPMDVSTAYWRDIEPVAGDWNGTAYNGIQRNLRPDHLALLPGGTGACSWADGCGTPRVNEAIDGARLSGVLVGDNILMVNDGTTWKRVEDETVNGGGTGAEAPAANNTNGGNEMDEGTKPLVKDCGDCPENTPDPVTNEEAAPISAVEIVGAQEPAVSPELEALLAVVSEYGGVDAFKEALLQFKANAAAERDGLIAAITANKASAFTADDLGTMTTEQLRKLDASLRPADYSGRGLPVANRNQSEWAPYVAPEV